MSVTISVVIHIHTEYFEHIQAVESHTRTRTRTDTHGKYKHFYDTKLMAS